MKKRQIILTVLVCMFIFPSMALSAYWEKTLYKSSESFAENLKIVNVECVKVVIASQYEDAHLEVIRRLISDGWQTERCGHFALAGMILVDSPGTASIMFGYGDDGRGRVRDIVSLLNIGLIKNNIVELVSTGFEATTSLSKKIKHFAQVGEVSIGDEEDINNFLNISVMSQGSTEKADRRLIMSAHRKIVESIRNPGPSKKGYQGWRGGRIGENVGSIELYFSDDDLMIEIKIDGKKVRNFPYNQNRVANIVKYLHRDIRSAGHTGIKNGVYRW